MKEVSHATTYALLIPDLMKAGREVGYSICVHGSLARDLDLVAVPWTEDAVNAERLILHLVAAVDGRLRNGGRKREDGEWETVPASSPTVKPHGRLAWTIHLEGRYSNLYLDVSVMPLATSKPDALVDGVRESTERVGDRSVQASPPRPSPAGVTESLSGRRSRPGDGARKKFKEKHK